MKPEIFSGHSLHSSIFGHPPIFNSGYAYGTVDYLLSVLRSTACIGHALQYVCHNLS